MLLAAPAAAQEFDVENFRLSSPGDGELLAVHSTRMAPAGQLALNLLFGYGVNELVAVDGGGDRVASIVGTRVGTDLAAAYGLGRLELSAALPLVMYQHGSADSGSGVATAGGNGIGDLRLQVRGRLYGDGLAGVGLSASVMVSVPTSSGVDFGGDASPSVSPRLVLELRGARALMALNLGGRVRESQVLPMGQLSIGSALTYGAGLLVHVPQLAGLGVVAELEGESAGMRFEESPLEARGGLRYSLPGGMAVSAGYGHGLIFGYGAPDHRFFLALVWRPAAKAEPTTVRPIAVAAAAPAEPVQPPTNPDPDGDGLLGAADACPEVAEDFDGFEDHDGCPEADNDKDTIVDGADACPNNAEDVDGFADTDGCPEPDNDLDGLVDASDKCPNEAEVINGNQDDDGCPDEGKQLVVITDSKLEIKEKLYFATGKDVILPRSEPVLSQLALTLERNSWIKQVRIEGHTDEQGEDAMNLDLSQRRATSVRKTLIERGIAADRLEAVGYGEKQPIDTNKTVDGRANNRRTEFVITVQDSRGMKPEGVKLESRPAAEVKP